MINTNTSSKTALPPQTSCKPSVVVTTSVWMSFNLGSNHSNLSLLFYKARVTIEWPAGTDEARSAFKSSPLNLKKLC